MRSITGATLCCLGLGVAGLPAPASPADAADPGASAAPEGNSHWGPIPEPSDSTLAPFRSRPMPLWEASLVWPYRILTFPLFLVYEGIHHLYLWTVPPLRRFLAEVSGPDLPVEIRPSFGYGTGGGFGGGLEITDTDVFQPGNQLRLRAEASTRGERRVTLGYRHEGPTGIQFGSGHRLEPYSRFYGLGPESRQEDESFYTLELNWLGLSASQRLTERFELTAEVLYSAVGARPPGSKETPPLGQVFPVAPPGFGGTTDGMSLGLTLSRGTLTQDGRPDRGSLRRIKVARFESIGEGEPSYWQFRFEGQEFIPLWFDRRALAFRGMVTWVDAVHDEPVTFPQLPSNDEPDLFRGYQDFRFHDSGMALATLEYRWPIWAFMDRDSKGLDAYLFTDVGQVFGDTDELSLRHLRWSYGFGIRLLGKSQFLTRLECAWSEEGFQFRISGHQVLQFTRGDLYHGRNPIPFR